MGDARSDSNSWVSIHSLESDDGDDHEVSTPPPKKAKLNTCTSIIPYAAPASPPPPPPPQNAPEPPPAQPVELKPRAVATRNWGPKKNKPGDEKKLPEPEAPRNPPGEMRKRPVATRNWGPTKRLEAGSHECPVNHAPAAPAAPAAAAGSGGSICGAEKEVNPGKMKKMILKKGKPVMEANGRRQEAAESRVVKISKLKGPPVIMREGEVTSKKNAIVAKHSNKEMRVFTKRPRVTETTCPKKPAAKGALEKQLKLPKDKHKAQEDLQLQVSDSRERVLDALKTFQKMRQNGNSETPQSTAMRMRLQGKWIDHGTQHVGHPPGVQVGDTFRFRAELCIVNLHNQTQAGIGWIKGELNNWGVPVAVSIVLSEGYYANRDDGDTFIYVGSGDQSKDQVLTRGNLALVNSFKNKVPVRVIRAITWNKLLRYDGLYRVTSYWEDRNAQGCRVYKFRMDALGPQNSSGVAKGKKLLLKAA